MYDWANSPFGSTVVTTFLGPYLAELARAQGGFVDLFGYGIEADAFFPYCVSLSVGMQVLFLPILGTLADYTPLKKTLLLTFAYTGAIATILLFLVQGDLVVLGGLLFLIANLSFGAALVFYNAFLPVIVTEDQYDRVSARGFSFGYIGSVILLVFNLTMIIFYETFGFPDKGAATRFAFLTVGLWWIGFALIPFSRLPSDEKQKATPDLLMRGAQELRKVWRAVKHQKNTKNFLFSFFCYSAGVQTVLFLAATFAEKELHFGTAELIGVVLILQLVAIVGAVSFARLSEWKGNKLALLTMLIIWVAICLVGYFVQAKWQFYAIAAAVGLVMGGIQSLSRSTYSKLIPEETKDPTSYFSFYDVLEKTAIIIGTFSFGFVEQLTGSMRISLLVMGSFFIAGLLILLSVRIRRGEGVRG